MDDVLYEVRVTALASAHQPSQRIAAAFAEIVCVSVTEAEARLSSLPLRVRGNLTLDQAQKYGRVLGRAGLQCDILPQRAEGAGAGDATEALGQEA